MPCNSSHIDASGLETKISQVACLLEELNGIPINPSHWSGYHPQVYNKNLSRKECDALVEELCQKLQKVDVKKYSLEMQIWWRDHQKADQERIARELEEARTRAAKATALSKLTPYEKSLLGLELTPYEKTIIGLNQ